MSEGNFDLDEALYSLGNTPSTLQGFISGMPDSWLDFKEEVDAWSPRFVLVHLIHNEQTNWIVRTRVILSDVEDKTFPPFSQMPEKEDFPPLGTDSLLDQFASLRSANLTELREYGLKDEDLVREGIHPDLGSVNLGQLLATWVVHDFNHLHQIAKSLSKRYTEAVGPWRPNLAIIDA